MKPIFATIAAALFLPLLACDDAPELRACDSGQREVVCSLAANARFVEESDGGLTYVLTVEAEIPDLIGAAKAIVVTSAGTLGGSAAGAPAIVLLAQSPEGSFQGEIDLHLPPGRSARIDVVVGETTATTLVPAR